MAFFRRRGANIDIGQAFRDNRELQQFVLTDVTPTGRKLGTGSFGSVEEVSPSLHYQASLHELDIFLSTGHIPADHLCWQENT